MAPKIHVKFKVGDARFGVMHKGRLRGINRDLVLYKWDGDEWNYCTDASQEEATGSPVGEVSDTQLERWGRSEAEFFA